jgi:hypothetical protein
LPSDYFYCENNVKPKDGTFSTRPGIKKLVRRENAEIFSEKIWVCVSCSHVHFMKSSRLSLGLEQPTDEYL